MPDTLIASILGQSLSLGPVLLCTAASLLLGLAIALVHSFRNHVSKGFAVTLALLPAVVQLVIMMVNGNIGAGVAVAGAFSLVRFRSVPGSARDIGSIFLAMAIGLATGMGYLFIAVLFTLIIGGATLLLVSTPIGENDGGLRIIRITIPESLDYDGLFTDVFEKYTLSSSLERVRTTNMGSLFELTYSAVFRGGAVPKEFVDQLRCRNANLNISVSRQTGTKDEL